MRHATDTPREGVPGVPQAIHTPGHTEGHCTFYLEKTRVLFSADALITANLLTGEPSSPKMPYRYSNADPRQAYMSLYRLGDLGYVTLLPGYGEPWKGEARDLVKVGRAEQERPR